MKNAQTYEQVLQAITTEISNQNIKWGDDRPQSLAGFLLILRRQLNQAEESWVKDLHSPSVLEEIVQVAAVSIECLKRYGVKGSAIPTNDIAVLYDGK